MGNPIAKCRGCGSEIIWARTRTGAFCPFDAVPVALGDWELVWEKGRPTAQKLRRFNGDGRDGYSSHFATCSTPEFWRKKR